MKNAISFGLLFLGALTGTVSLADSIFSVRANSGEVLSTGDLLSNLSTETSINLAGDIAFGATLTGPTGTGSGVVLVGDNVQPQRLTFSPSSTRRYSTIQLNNSGKVVARELITGSPPANFARNWAAGGSFSVLADTNAGIFSGIVLTSLANDGGSAFVGLTNGGATTGLYVNPFGARADNRLVYTFTGAGARPVIGDNGRVVMRIGDAASQTLRFSAPDAAGVGYAFRTISSNTMARIGATPGITDDGTLAAFYAEDAGGAGIFVANLTKPGAPTRIVSIGEKLNGAVTGRTIAGILADSKIAVEKIDSLIGQQYRILFSAVDDTGTLSLVNSRVDANLNQTYERSVIASVGRSIELSGGISTTVPAQLASGDSLNSRGGIVFVASSATQQQIVSGNLAPLTKYKQFDDGNVFNDWFDKQLNETLPANSNTVFSKRGCFITSVATISTQFGREMNPLQLRDLALAQGVMIGNDFFLTGTMSTSGLKLDSEHALKATGKNATINDLATSLRAGKSVLLRVPTSHFLNNGSDGTLHAIVAYGINPKLGPNNMVTAKDIFVSDPGSLGYYKNKYAQAYTPGEQLVDVTLQDVFDRMNEASSSYTFDAQKWFDEGTFIRDVDLSSLTIPESLLAGKGNMTFFDIVNPFVGPPAPSIGVNSPVDLVIIDRSTSQRFVTSQSLMLAGDILLAKSFGEIGGDEVEGTLTPTTAYPHYSVLLPDGYFGHSFDVEAHGLADGEYTISLFSGGDQFKSSAPLRGSIVAGAVVQGVLAVTAVPEPPKVALLLAGMVFTLFSAMARGRRNAHLVA